MLLLLFWAFFCFIYSSISPLLSNSVFLLLPPRRNENSDVGDSLVEELSAPHPSESSILSAEEVATGATGEKRVAVNEVPGMWGIKSEV